MPAASSKPAPQTTPLEGQDTVKQLVAVVDKKIRNLEKRKTKLDGYREMVTSGKGLNKDQEEAVSHFEEVGASLEFAKELSKQFTTILNEATKAQKREAKREKQQKHEQELGRISEVLLLQNVLNNMGQPHVRADFLAGTNGALVLQEQELDHLDEFYKLVNPTRKGESEEEEETDDISFEKKLEISTNHLNSYLKEDEREVCETTYKNLFHLVQRIHKCDYLDNMPPPPEEPAPETEEPAPATVPAAAPSAAYETQEQEEETYEETYQENTQEFVESLNEAPSESFFTGVPSEQIQQAPGMQSTQSEIPQMQSMSSEPQQHKPQQTLNEMAPPSRVHDLPQAPEPIEMPPPKQAHHDVNEVLAPVLGSFNFVQDSMLDYDSPHMDPAVVAVSQQPFIPSATFTNNVQSSTNTQDLSQTEQASQPVVRDHQTLADSLAAQQQQIPSEQTYQQQSRYDGSQQTYGSQSLTDQTPYANQTLDTGSSGYGGQADLSSASSAQVDYGSSQTPSTSGKMNELPEFPSPPVDTQQDQSVLQTTILNQQNLSHSTAQYSESYSPSLGSSQLGNDGVPSSSSPLTITDPSQASIPLPGEQTSSDVQQGSIPPKSTMNASAPPFQMTNSMRSSPQMQAMQSTPTGQVGQPQDMSAYTGMDQSQDFNHSGGRDVDRTHSPSQDLKMDHQQQSTEGPGNSYSSNYQPYYKNGRGGKPRGGGNPNFRGSRGNAPFIRGGARYTPPQSRGGQMNFNTFGHRDAFAPRGPDMSYNPQARYGGFSQVQQEQSYYNRRGGGMPRGGPRGGGRGAQGGPRNQAPYRGGRGSFGKPSQVTV